MLQDNDSYRYYSSGQLNDLYPAKLTQHTNDEEDTWTLGSVISLVIPLKHNDKEKPKEKNSGLPQPAYPQKKWQPPDGGYGWVVVFASFLIQAITGSVGYIQGMLYPEFLNAFGAGRVTTAWASSMQVAVWFTGAMIAGPMVQTIGIRKVCMIGATIITASLFISSLAVHISMLYIFYGITCGIGMSFIFFPAIIVVQQYFVKKRSLAVAFANSGAPFGGFAMPPLCDFLLQQYGWRGTLMIMAGITAQVFVICYFFKPLPKPTFDEDYDEKKTLDRDDDQDSVVKKLGEDGLPVIEKKPSKLKAFVGRLFDFSLLKNPNMTFDMMAYGFFSFGFIVPSMFLPLKARELGIPHPKPTLLISIIGISDVTGRFVTGFVGQVLGKKRLIHYMISMLMGGTVTALSSLLHRFIGLAMYSCMFGLCTGMTRAYSSIVLTDMLGLENLPKAYAFKLFLNGFTVLGSAPFAAFVMDSTQSIDMSFLIIGIVQAMGGGTIFILLILRKCGCAPVRSSWL